MSKVYIILEVISEDYSTPDKTILGVFSSIDKCVEYLKDSKDLSEDQVNNLSVNLEVNFELFSGYHFCYVLPYKIDEELKLN